MAIPSKHRIYELMEEEGNFKCTGCRTVFEPGEQFIAVLRDDKIVDRKCLLCQARLKPTGRSKP